MLYEVITEYLVHHLGLVGAKEDQVAWLRIQGLGHGGNFLLAEELGDRRLPP